MSGLATIETASLPSLVRRAADQLAKATSAAEVLDARDMANAAYDAAKSAARIARAKGAHDELIAKVHRAQADALEIEAMAKRRLADEYDAAQERGEVATRADQNLLPERKKVSVSDLGLTHKTIHEARQIRDAERLDPGIVNRTVMERLDAGHEPTKAALRQAITDAIVRGGRSAPTPSRRNPEYRPNPARDVALRVDGSCRDISEAFEAKGAAAILGGFHPAFRPLANELKSKAYTVPSIGEVVSVPVLIQDPALLREAAEFMEQKGLECLDEARRLFALLRAVEGENA